EVARHFVAGAAWIRREAYHRDDLRRAHDPLDRRLVLVDRQLWRAQGHFADLAGVICKHCGLPSRAARDVSYPLGIVIHNGAAAPDAGWETRLTWREAA